jgi:ABC-type methionine transport system permease subunit
VKILLAFLILASTAQAQTFKVAGIGLYASSAVDMATTRYAMSRGAVELNPIAGQNMQRQAAVSFGAASSTLITTRYLHESHPKMALGIRLAYIGMRVFVGVHNVRVGNR